MAARKIELDEMAARCSTRWLAIYLGLMVEMTASRFPICCAPTKRSNHFWMSWKPIPVMNSPLRKSVPSAVSVKAASPRGKTSNVKTSLPGRMHQAEVQVPKVGHVAYGINDTTHLDIIST